jgi:nucleotide-binding universal stress UspA family protein
VEILVAEGSPTTQILDSVTEIGADAIAMCTRSRRGLNRLMFGSVAETVLHETALPILLVRSRNS